MTGDAAKVGPHGRQITNHQKYRATPISRRPRPPPEQSDHRCGLKRSPSRVATSEHLGPEKFMRSWKSPILASALLLGMWSSATVPADAADKISATLDLTAYLSKLTFRRSPDVGPSRPVKLSSGIVHITFSDPRNQSEIERILFDVKYRPGTPQVADFFTTTQITDPISKQVWKETSLCNWTGAKKRTANCQIENDGGGYQILLRRSGSAPSDGALNFKIVMLGGYKGFRIASSDDEQSSIDLSLRRRQPITIGIDF
jgi:hypothetical protein